MIAKEKESSYRPFWALLRIKPHDNMLIFLFAKTRGSSLIQSTNIFLWATFTLYSIKYTILDQFSAFLKILPPGQLRIFQNQLFISNHDIIHLIGSFAGLLKKKSSPKTLILNALGVFFDKADPLKTNFQEKCKIC